MLRQEMSEGTQNAYQTPNRSSLGEQVLDSLVRAIVRGDYPPGRPFESESEIAGIFGVSKPTARETVKLLKAHGLVDIGHGRRTIVTDISEWDVLSPAVASAFENENRGQELAAQYWQLRQIVETNAARLAAMNATDEERSALQEMATAMEQPVDDLATLLRIDRDFHDLVARASRNLALRRVAVPIHEFLAWSSRSRLTVDLTEALLGQHHRIAAAIDDGDGDAAATAMEAHITWAMNVENRDAEES
jgi:DNA-binding FadR family transcriptional regulator